jgi:hypothetical protein
MEAFIFSQQEVVESKVKIKGGPCSSFVWRPLAFRFALPAMHLLALATFLSITPWALASRSSNCNCN